MKQGLQDPERKKLLEIAAKHPGAWVHDEEVEIDYKNPTAINPKPFYDYIVLNIAAVLNMPTHILTGIQTGRVTGSEIGFSDYYRDVRDEQQLIFEPEIKKLYTRILIAKGRKFKYKFRWNDIYVDEGMEVEQLVKKVQAAETALNGVRGAGGFITKQEARKMLNDGQIKVDPDDISGLKGNAQLEAAKQASKNAEKNPPYDREPGKPGDKKPEPNRPPSPSLHSKIRGGLTEIEKDMIVRCKEAKKKLAAKERKLGEDILKEQDEDDASNKNDN
jgi:hypothetical protein